MRFKYVVFFFSKLEFHSLGKKKKKQNKTKTGKWDEVTRLTLNTNDEEVL